MGSCDQFAMEIFFREWMGKLARKMGKYTDEEAVFSELDVFFLFVVVFQGLTFSFSYACRLSSFVGSFAQSFQVGHRF